MSKKQIQANVVLILSLIFLISCKEKNNNDPKVNDWKIVTKSVNEVSIILNQRHDLINEIYNDISSEKVDINLVKLEKIKALSIELEKTIKKNNELLFEKYTKQTQTGMFDLGLNYINGSVFLEKLLPIFYHQMTNDIKGKRTEPNSDVVLGFRYLITSSERYQTSMNKYRTKYNLDVEEISISTKNFEKNLYFLEKR